MVVSAECRVHVPLRLAAVVPWNGKHGTVGRGQSLSPPQEARKGQAHTDENMCGMLEDLICKAGRAAGGWHCTLQVKQGGRSKEDRASYLEFNAAN